MQLHGVPHARIPVTRLIWKPKVLQNLDEFGLKMVKVYFHAGNMNGKLIT